MTIRVPITVALVTAAESADITGELQDLTFRITAPGGFASATFRLLRPVGTYLDVAEYTTVRVSDSRNATILWEGRLEDPGKNIDSSRAGFDLAAVGPIAHAKDIKRPYVAVDAKMDSWERLTVWSLPFVDETLEENPDIGTALRITASPGGVVPASTDVWLSHHYYPVLAESGQTLAVVSGERISGLTAGVGSPDPVSFLIGVYVADDINMSNLQVSTESILYPTVDPFLDHHGSGWASAVRAVPVLRWRWTDSGAAFTAGSAAWVAWHVIVRPHMHTLTGSLISAGSLTPSTTTSGEIVTDLLGMGRLPLFDAAGASVATGATVTQFAYRKPVTIAEMLDDLMRLDPANYWAAWERNSAGLHRFEWTPWSSAIRYVLDADDGVDLPGSTAELYNAVGVAWVDGIARQRLTRRTSTVSMLPFTREASLDLTGRGVIHDADAEAAGDAFLAEHATPFASGTATVRRPIIDMWTGHKVHPHELRPGGLVQVRGLAPASSASVTATARDGRSVFRCTAVDYRASDNAATLELDGSPRNISDQVAAGLGQ